MTTVSHRERMLRAFDFANPDRLPVYYHPSPAGLHVHGQKLLDLFRACPSDNDLEFDGLPQPDPATVDADGAYHEFKRDAFGTVWEHRIFGIQGHPHAYPIPDWSAPYEFPAVPASGSLECRQLAAANARRRQDYLIFGGGISLFERLCAMRPFDEVLMDLMEETPGVLRMLDRLQEYQARQIDFCLAAGQEVILFGDDWGTQQSLILPPALFRRLFRPRLRALMDRVHAAGARVLYHSCGAVHALVPDLVACGSNGLWHQLGLYDAEAFADECARRRLFLFLHLDRQRLVPLGTPQEIRDTVRRYADLHLARGGGAAFYIEIENDAPWPNVEALILAVHDQ
jgi:hypothetical protein